MRRRAKFIKKRGIISVTPMLETHHMSSVSSIKFHMEVKIKILHRKSFGFYTLYKKKADLSSYEAKSDGNYQWKQVI